MRIDVLNYFSKLRRSKLKTAIATYLHALFKSLSFMSLNEIYFLGGLLVQVMKLQVMVDKSWISLHDDFSLH